MKAGFQRRPCRWLASAAAILLLGVSTVSASVCEAWCLGEATRTPVRSADAHPCHEAPANGQKKPGTHEGGCAHLLAGELTIAASRATLKASLMLSSTLPPATAIVAALYVFSAEQNEFSAHSRILRSEVLLLLPAAVPLRI